MAGELKRGGAPVTASASLPDGWEEWPTLAQAAPLIGLTPSKLAQLVKLGAIKKYAAPNSKGSMLGSYRFNPEDLERLEEQLQDEAEQSAQPSTADLVRASVEGLKQAQAHSERLITLFDGPYKFVLDALRAENEALRIDNAALRSERKALEALREEMRATRAVEEIALTELKQGHETKQQALEIAKPLVKHFVNAALLKGGADPRLLALRDAVEGIPRSTFEALFATELLPADVVEKLKVGLAWDDAPPAEVKAAE